LKRGRPSVKLAAPQFAADRYRMRRATLVCLDLDDTLWALTPVLERAERLFHAWLERHYPRVTQRHSVESLRALRAQVADERPESGHDLGALRRETYRRLAHEAGYPEALVEDGFQVFQRLRNEVCLYADVEPALRRLARAHRLVALTNGNADLTAIGLDGYFSRVFTAAEIGIAKPEPEIFAAVCEAMQVAPEQVLHAGNDPEHDIVAAKRAGLTAVWVNRAGDPWPGEAPGPDAEVRDLGALATLVGA